jgi:hypothetical protein
MSCECAAVPRRQLVSRRQLSGEATSIVRLRERGRRDRGVLYYVRTHVVSHASQHARAKRNSVDLWVWGFTNGQRRTSASCGTDCGSSFVTLWHDGAGNKPPQWPFGTCAHQRPGSFHAWPHHRCDSCRCPIARRLRLDAGIAIGGSLIISYPPGMTALPAKARWWPGLSSGTRDMMRRDCLWAGP